MLRIAKETTAGDVVNLIAVWINEGLIAPTCQFPLWEGAKAFARSLTGGDSLVPAHTHGGRISQAHQGCGCGATVGGHVEIVDALVHNGQDVAYAEIKSVHGHDSFLMQDAHYHAIMRAYLDGVPT